MSLMLRMAILRSLIVHNAKPVVGIGSIFYDLLSGKDDQEADDILEEANREAVAGLKAKEKGKEGKEVQSKDSKKSKTALSKHKLYTLGCMYIDYCGTKTVMEKDGSKSLQPIVNLPTKKIPLDAKFPEIEKYIQKLVPGPFEYWDTYCKKDISPYIFTMVEQKKFAVCQDLTEPDVLEFKTITKGNSGTGYDNNHLFIYSAKETTQTHRQYKLDNGEPSSDSDGTNYSDNSSIPGKRKAKVLTAVVTRKYH
uniref:Uncharacterized protein n=1 Tax=Moniliophthora roreri TaxID=221103 RepID=A0A0W0G8X2_MONRR